MRIRHKQSDVRFIETPIPQDLVDFWAKYGGLWMEESDRMTRVPVGRNMRPGYLVTPAVINDSGKVPILMGDIELHMGGPTVADAAMRRIEGC